MTEIATSLYPVIFTGLITVWISIDEMITTPLIP